MSWVLVAIGGSIGALARFEMGTWIAQHTDSRLPVGTMAVNTLGSLLAGMAWSADLSGSTAAFLSGGFLGGFTTFSTWMVETGRLLEDDDRPGRGLANVGLMLLTGLVGVTLGASMF